MSALCARAVLCVGLAGLVWPAVSVAKQSPSGGSQSVSSPLANWLQREPPGLLLGGDFPEFARNSRLEFLGRVRPERVYRGVLSGRVWASGEYLAWATKGQDVPPLLSTRPITGPPTAAAVIGAPGTRVLAGSESLHDELRSGGRGTIGCCFTPFQTSGVEASYFGIDGRDAFTSVNSTERAVIARPYVQVPGNIEQSLLVAYPGLLEGQTDVRLDMDLTGATVLLRRALVWVPGFRLDLLSGYRYGYLSDGLEVQDTSLSLDAASGFAQDALVERSDFFRTTNDFHGGELGLSTRWFRRRLSLNLLARVALGRTWTKSVVRGQTTVSELVGNQLTVTHFDGGVLALPSNIGNVDKSEFGAMSEFGVAIEYDLCHNMRAALGYTFLYWNSVARSAAQIDRRINPTQIPPESLSGVACPQFHLPRTDFWAQGLNVRLEYQF